MKKEKRATEMKSVSKQIRGNERARGGECDKVRKGEKKNKEKKKKRETEYKEKMKII